MDWKIELIPVPVPLSDPDGNGWVLQESPPRD